MSQTEDEESPLLVTNEGRLRILTLNRPERLNALDTDLHHRLQAAVVAAATDPDVGALVVTGAGRGFCSGGDVQRRGSDQAQPESIEDRADSIRSHGLTVRMLSEMPKPTIALINGAAAGSGLAIALACDIRVAMRGAVFQAAYARIGLPGDLGISFFLTRCVGPALARQLMLLNEKIDAEEALRLGLVSRVFEPDLFMDNALDLARTLAAGPTVAFRYMKQNLHVAETGTLEAVIEREAYNTARCARTRDVAEAIAALKEKRAPSFTGR